MEKMPMEIPDHIVKIMQTLGAAGHEAFVAGGAVRDSLLGIDPHDWDVTTSARPEEGADILKKAGFHVVEDLGKNFGVITCVADGIPVEIATFRGERYGADPHRPEEVWYCDNIEDDLSRRDFTVNAMAMDLSGRIIDPYGGQKDLERKVIRTVGDPKRRYGEDALRMYRACRFVAQLGFSYEEDGTGDGPFGEEGTPYYLPVRYRFDVSGCRELSLERVRGELEKILTADHAGKGLMMLLASGLASSSCRVRENGEDTYIDVLPELEHLPGLPQNPNFHCYEVWEHILAAVDGGTKELIVRWALLLHDVAKGLPGIRCMNERTGYPSDFGHEKESARMAEKILTRLRYPQDFVRRAVWLVSQHMHFVPMLVTGRTDIRKWVRKEAVSGLFRTEKELADAYRQLAAVFAGDMGATWSGLKNDDAAQKGRALARRVIDFAAQKMPVHTSDLEISGGDIEKMLPDGDKSATGSLLKYLLARVQTGNLPNEKEKLLSAVQKKIKKDIETEE